MSLTKAGAAVGVMLAAGALVSARQAAPPPDVLPALLEEVKGLRAAMEQMATAGPRIQLFTSRLQLQESRINNMIHRLDTVRDSLAQAQRDYGRAQDQQRVLDSAIEEHRNANTSEGQEELKQTQIMSAQAKRDTASAKSSVDRYAAEEAQLAAEISTEQARWTDINARLDELERLLSKR